MSTNLSPSEPAGPRSTDRGSGDGHAPAVGGAAAGSDAGVVTRICPLLQGTDGAWREAAASRDHRCWAVRPPAPVSSGKQRQLCLTERYPACATFAAAGGPMQDGWIAPTGEGIAAAGSTLWPAVRTTPVILAGARAGGRLGFRAGSQAGLVLLMGLAFAVLVFARTTNPSIVPGDATAAPTTALATPTRSATPTTEPSPSNVAPTASATPVASAAPTPAPTPGPTPVPTATPAGSGRTYVVQSGDTLYIIAVRFGTTVEAIAEANGITDPGVIRPGQILFIP